MTPTDPRQLPFAVFDEFGKPADDRVQDHIYAALSEALGDSQPVAPEWVRDGIADFIETNWPHNEYWPPDIAERIRTIEIRPPLALPQRAEPASVQALSRNATERARAWETSPERVREVLRELVDGLERTNWSSWQTTAHFSTQLAAAQNLLAALAAHPSTDQNHSG